MSAAPGHRNAPFSPANRRPLGQPEHHWRPGRPPGPRPPFSSAGRRPNFVIELYSETQSPKTHIPTVMEKFPSVPDGFVLHDSGPVAGRFFYQQWPEALCTLVHLWGARLDGGLAFHPRLVRNLIVPSDTEELSSVLRALFAERVRGLMEGDSVKRWEARAEAVATEIGKTEALLRRWKSMADFDKLRNRREGSVREKHTMERRVWEFRSAMACVLDYLDGAPVDDSYVMPLKLGGDFDWNKIYSVVRRECRRLDDGLPVYAARTDLLSQIHSQQVTVLIGETGSGKSTQLVQYLADSGVAAAKSVVCTQPRKLAASSLANRVQEESRGCYRHNSVACHHSSVGHSASKVVYTTDHGLLQRYMTDRDFSDISCVIVDEAHERSLNTDLLLAVIKDLLLRRLDMRVVVMSATADARQFADYFFGCGTCRVTGRNFPVDIRYVPGPSGPNDSAAVPPYVSEVVRRAREIHQTENDNGTVLAFLTSQTEVEWACENLRVPSAAALPLHGRLSHEEQYRVYRSYPGKRKVIFSTNLAETSLTIPGVRYVVDSGMVKESRFEPGTGMNVLRVCRISKSSADQRAGRAGRTEPGKCYRLYGETDFESMPSHQEPEIRRVHLGVAVLRILALGVKNVADFDFVNAPCAAAIETAVENLVRLGAVVPENDVYELTEVGQSMVKLGIEPRLGKMILKGFDHELRREGVVLAAVMANSSGVFCRVGNEEDKRESDRRKVQFCHRNGDLFTFLSVYRQWENLPPENRNRWCWDNSVNAKAMRRCHETVREIEACLEHELHLIVPSYWQWTPERDGLVKHVILSALLENVATFSGNDHVGYEVAVSGTHVPLHPSCSLLAFGDRPSWVVFGEILATHNRYLVCVTSVDLESLYALSPSPPFDVSEIDGRRLRRKVLTGFGTVLLKKFCGRLGSGLKHLTARIRATVADDRVMVKVSVDRNEVDVFASARDMNEVCEFVNDALARERKWLRNECLEKCLYPGRRASAQVALFGAGAEIKHLELENRCLTVDVYHPTPNDVDEKELLSFLERETCGEICGVHRFGPEGNEKWGRVTFLTPAAAEAAAAVAIDFDGVSLRVVPAGGENRFAPFPAIKAKVSWPRRRNRGFAFIKCATVNDVSAVIGDLSGVLIGGKFIRSKQSSKFTDSVILNGLDSEVFDDEIYKAVAAATDRRVLDIHVPRGDPVDHPPVAALEDALLREIRSFMAASERVRVHVFEPEPMDHSVRAEISFDWSLHLEAARALEQIEGKAVPGCEPWQKVKCHHQFHSSVSCPAAVYYVIRDPLDSLLRRLRLRKGAELNLDRNENGSYRVRISAKATKIMADLRRPLEELLNGKTIHDPRLTPPILLLLFSRDGFALQRSVQRETGTYFLIDRQSHGLRVFGPLEKLDTAHQRMVQALLELHERKQLYVNLRGGGLPSDLMKTVVERFGPDLRGLKERFPGSDFTLNTRDHVISVHGPKDGKWKAEDAIREIAQTGGGAGGLDAAACAICLCDVDDGYRLETCRHEFCRGCLLEQCESAARTHDGFPLRCARGGCGAPLLVADLKSLAPAEKLDGLFRAAVGAFVTASGGGYRFCPSPDCAAVYRVADPGGEAAAAFACGACSVETCRRCHVEYHPFVSCEMYREFKRHPDASLEEWVKGREGVKRCPGCGFTIEKVDGCNHVECRCGRHICWVCRECFPTSDECYGHLRSVHHAIG